MSRKPGARRTLILVALAVTLGAVYWVENLEGEAPVEDGVVPALPAREPTGARMQPMAPSSVDAKGSLDLARLHRAPAAEPGGELFGEPPASIAPPPALPARGRQAAVQPEPPPPPPEPPPLPFRYLGQLLEGERRMVFLVAGERNLVVGAGDVIDNVYRVDEIGEDALRLTYLPMNVQQTLPTGAAQ